MTTEPFLIRVTFNDGSQALVSPSGGFTCALPWAGEWDRRDAAMAIRYVVQRHSPEVIGIEVVQRGVDGSLPPHQYPYMEVA